MRRLPYLPGVDGLRAVAVVAVVLYHADVAWLPAGFLGVDVFFVISGYLIASLLLAEHAATGTVAIAAFWRRRARRLLPGLFALLGGVGFAGLVVARDAADRAAGDIPAAVLYVSNWWQVLRGESYFDSIGRPPLLRHLWSLAVEEQFYVVVPVVLGALCARRVRRRWLVAGAVGVALASASLMALLWQPGDASRAYYGTDTRAAPLLLGVALAVAWAPWRLRAAIPARGRDLLDGGGIVALAGLAVLATQADEFGPGLYRGGFLLAAALAAVVVAVAAHPATRMAGVLGRGPLRWLGTRSYAVYLWHWPVVVLTRPGLDVDLHGTALLALRLTLSLLLAEASYQLVEQPFRDGRALRLLRRLPRPSRRRVVAAGAGLALTGWAAVAVVPAAPTDAQLLASTSGSTLATWPSTTSAPEPVVTSTTAAPSTPTTVAPSTDTTAPAPDTASTPAPAPAPVAPGPPAAPVLAIGDSVLLASRTALERASGDMVQVDAAVGRQVWDVLEILERYRASGALDRLGALVVHLGTNGPLHPADFDRLAAAVDGVPRVVVVNVRVPRRWEDTTNATVRDGVPRYATMRLVDWYTASGEPGMLGGDGVHPTPAGAEAYARIVLAQLDALAAPPPPTTTATSEPPPTPPPTPPSTTTSAPPPTAAPPPEEPTTTPTSAPPAPAPAPPVAAPAGFDGG